MNELSARFLVRTCDELAESAINCDENFVSIVKVETLDEGGVGPVREALFDLAGEIVKGMGRSLSNILHDVSLQVSRIKFAVVVLRKLVRRRAYGMRDGWAHVDLCRLGKFHKSAADQRRGLQIQQCCVSPFTGCLMVASGNCSRIKSAV